MDFARRYAASLVSDAFSDALYHEQRNYILRRSILLIESLFGRLLRELCEENAKTFAPNIVLPFFHTMLPVHALISASTLQSRHAILLNRV